MEMIAWDHIGPSIVMGGGGRNTKIMQGQDTQFQNVLLKSGLLSRP